MTWRLLNKLFGWQYVEYRDSCVTFIARVKETPNGRLRMEAGFFLDQYSALLRSDGTFEGADGRWSPLTFNIVEKDSQEEKQ